MLEYANKVLFIDTDSLITLYYYKLDFGIKNKEDKVFESISEGISYLNKYDLYIFLEPDVKCVQDGSRTYGDQNIREENNKILKELLKKNNIKYVSINGDYQNRYKKSIELVNKLIGE
jgi:HTH-type transcriptional repressor of NAD biosynthesis genes